MRENVIARLCSLEYYTSFLKVSIQECVACKVKTTQLTCVATISDSLRFKPFHKFITMTLTVYMIRLQAPVKGL